jgi:predicted nucleic acid-binding protein
MLITQGESAAHEVLEMMQQGRVLQLNGDNLFAAAQASAAHGLAMADATIWQTALIDVAT